MLIDLPGLAAGWLWHGPLGHGARFSAGSRPSAAAFARSELPASTSAFRATRFLVPRRSRLATTSSERREAKGLSDYVREVKGFSGVRWADYRAGLTLPLIAET